MFNPSKILGKIFKDSNQRELQKLRVVVDKINNLEQEGQKGNEGGKK